MLPDVDGRGRLGVVVGVDELNGSRRLVLPLQGEKSGRFTEDDVKEEEKRKNFDLVSRLEPGI